MSEFLTQLDVVLKKESFGFGDTSPQSLPLLGFSDLSVVEHFHFLPLPKILGRIFLKAELFSQKQDFTHAWQTKDRHENLSWLHKLWVSENTLDHHTSIRVWTVLKEGNPIGVVTLEQTDEVALEVGKQEFQELGALSVYLKPEFRSLGMMKAVMAQHVAPFLAEEVKLTAKSSRIPFVGAEDAAHTLLQDHFIKLAIPCAVVPFHHQSLERDAHLKSLLNESNFKTKVKL